MLVNDFRKRRVNRFGIRDIGIVGRDLWQVRTATIN